MTHTSKRSVELGTASKQSSFHYATVKLTFFYVLSTAVILFVSSVGVLVIFSPPKTEAPEMHTEVSGLIQEKDLRLEAETEVDDVEVALHDIRENLGVVIAFVDLLILLVVSLFSYWFAKRTLSPIKITHERQREFMGDVAHELRTPLSVLQAGAEATLRSERTSSEYTGFIKDVQEEATRLTRLTNQLLQFLKAGSVATVEQSTCNISELITREVTRFTAYASEHNVTLTASTSPDVTLTANADDITQIVQNLLKNAIDYNTADGTVTVGLSQEGTLVKLTVADSGVGIPKDKQEAVFSRFTKVNSARTNSTGTGSGLGLAIVKEIVKRYTATIDIDSTEKKGTKITVTFPTTSS